jgi:hypothetical protein
VERNLLTDDSGKIVPPGEASRFAYSYMDANDVDDAIHLSATGEGAELLAEVFRMSPQQGMATARRGRTVMTLHAFPEEEAEERLRPSAISS